MCLLMEESAFNETLCGVQFRSKPSDSDLGSANLAS